VDEPDIRVVLFSQKLKGAISMAEDKWRKTTRVAEALIRRKKIAFALRLRGMLSKVASENPEIEQYYRIFYDQVSALQLGLPVRLEALSAAAQIY